MRLRRTEKHVVSRLKMVLRCKSETNIPPLHSPHSPFVWIHRNHRRSLSHTSTQLPTACPRNDSWTPPNSINTQRHTLPLCPTPASQSYPLTSGTQMCPVTPKQSATTNCTIPLAIGATCGTTQCTRATHECEHHATTYHERCAHVSNT